MSTNFGAAYQEDVAYKAALERAEMLQGYYTHLLVYVVVNTGLFFINLFTRGNDGGWGSQAVDLSPAQGAIIEFSPQEDGMYPFVTHAFNFVGRGAVGIFMAGDGDPSN